MAEEPEGVFAGTVQDRHGEPAPGVLIFVRDDITGVPVLPDGGLFIDEADLNERVPLACATTAEDGTLRIPDTDRNVIPTLDDYRKVSRWLFGQLSLAGQAMIFDPPQCCAPALNPPICQRIEEI